MGIREDMPLLARHEGDWAGTYTWVDQDGNIIDKHASLLNCTFPTEGEFEYHQTNTYTWPDGRTEQSIFPGKYRDKRIYFDTERIDGHVWEVDENTICLTWVRKDDPSGFFYEMIQLDKEGKNRSRVWQWFENGVCTKRTLINEVKVA